MTELLRHPASSEVNEPIDINRLFGLHRVRKALKNSVKSVPPSVAYRLRSELKVRLCRVALADELRGSMSRVPELMNLLSPSIERTVPVCTLRLHDNLVLKVKGVRHTVPIVTQIEIDLLSVKIESLAGDGVTLRADALPWAAKLKLGRSNDLIPLWRGELREWSHRLGEDQVGEDQVNE